MHTTHRRVTSVSAIIAGLTLVIGLAVTGLAAGAASHASGPVALPLATNPLVVGTWSTISSMNAPREYQTATLLSNGQVLVAAGCADDPCVVVQTSAELYDPATGTWSITGSLNQGRGYQTATLLSNGQVLVAGGLGNNGSILASAELYDPVTGVFTYTGSLNTARYRHTATLLTDGRVLVVGGCCSGGAPLASAELYDPATGTWSTTGSLNTARSRHAMAPLADGKVLVTGGFDSAGNTIASAEVYDPATGTWSITGSMNDARQRHTATLLPNGQVLVAGGENDLYPYYLASAELYDPATGVFTYTGNMSTSRQRHTATLLADGTVLVAGGKGSSSNMSGTEVYDPATGTWTIAGNLNTGRFRHTATLLTDGTVLVAGGQGPPYFALTSAELYSATPGPTATPTPGPTATRTPKPNIIVNPGFESGPGIGWTEFSSSSHEIVTTEWSHTGSYSAHECGYDACSEYIQQQIVIPANGSLAYWWYMSSNEGSTSANDFLKVELYSTSGRLLRTLRTWDNTSTRDTWLRDSISIAPKAGQTVLLRFTATTDGALPTSFYIDDVVVR